VGVRGDKTCEVGGGIRVIVLGNFVESPVRHSHEISVLRQWFNVRRRDIQARRRSRDQHCTIEYLPSPEKGCDIEFLSTISANVADDEQRHIC